MHYYNNILETIGNTPLVKLNRLTKEVPGLVLAKVETTNPGNSVKDRMALQMVLDAEADGRLKPGGTIIEGTSGNTGMGLALAAIQRGYKVIFTLSDKQSKEKMDILRAVGAEVIVCPTNVEPEDPRSYYSVARRLEKEIPNSWYVNQYDNPSNAKAHYLTTGPEIWEQTQGKVTHFVVGVGTGGTISGVGKYLKEQNPNVKVLGIDTYGSVFKKYHETGVFDQNEIYPYITEGIGEDILPANVDFKVIDHFEKVTDKDGAIYTRLIAREEGIFVGNSAGSAVAGVLQMAQAGMFTKDSVVVILFHDHGSRYVGKMFNDDWMRERGFLTEKHKIIHIINSRKNKLVTVEPSATVLEAVEKMKKYDISQIPVMHNNEAIGTVDEHSLFRKIIDNPELNKATVKEVMDAPLPFVECNEYVDVASKKLTKEVPGLLTKTYSGEYHIVTKQDVINLMC
ncbi:MAG: pyridoxal-phosphate dependent enzyme [Luteibaculaceae bacterium]